MKASVLYIKVILPLKIEWEPWYSVNLLTQSEESQIETGERVLVKFAGKEYLGIISEIGLFPEIDINKIKQVISVERHLPKVSAKEIALWREVASYYLCTVGEVFKAAYPSFRRNSEKNKAVQNKRNELKIEKNIGAATKKILTFSERLERRLKSLEVARKDSVIMRLKDEIERLDAEIKKLDIEKEKLCQELSLCKSGRAFSTYQSKGNHTGELIECNICFSPAQEKAVEAIKDSFIKKKTALLKGVTGSGKTEIYISLAAETMNAGKSVLYLVPEIALSKQLEDRLAEIFGNRLIIFHSGETTAERAAATEMIYSARKTAETYIVLGTRSAILMPHNDLGLIIVDEEHDSSYKQDSPAPRYNGRDTAAMLSSIHSSNLLLGSATPSLESMYNCLTGKYALIELSEKFHGSAESDIMLVDTISERKKRGMNGSLSLKLIFEIQKTLERGEQTIILRSRRSYSPVLQCSECGNIPKCPNCNMALSYHKHSGTDLCHYCGYNKPHTGTCSVCGGTLTGLGAGTQKIEEEIAALFPKARIARLDSDSAQNRKYENEVIKNFSKGQTDILIGTQIVSKGFDFSGLTLVAIIGTDSLLGIQDFRADEKAMQILEQFRGRCGRREKKGLFIIQTSQPSHPVYMKITGKDSTLSLDGMMAERKEFHYPPFFRLIDINIKDSNLSRIEKLSKILSSELYKLKFDVTGPYTDWNNGVQGGTEIKPGGTHMRTIRISLPKGKNLSANKLLISKIVNNFESKYNYRGHVAADVDPA